MKIFNCIEIKIIRQKKHLEGNTVRGQHARIMDEGLFPLLVSKITYQVILYYFLKRIRTKHLFLPFGDKKQDMISIVDS